MLTAITFATTFFKPFFFEAALSVNLTTMLVLTTIFISKMESLPPTSATKMIDYWLILCQLVPFTQVVLLTIKENLREEDQDTLGKDDIQPPTLAKDNIKVTLRDETDPNEACTLPKSELTIASSTTVLAIIGEIYIKF